MAMESPMKMTERLPVIPEDVIFDYLLIRLPVKSLLRFKSVSKTWYDFIKKPNFKSKHPDFTTSKLLMVEYSYIGSPVFSFRFNDKSVTVLPPDVVIPMKRNCILRILDSCNGIVCYYDNRDRFEIFMCNPATREFKKLPPSSFLSEKNKLVNQCGLGFGFTTLTNNTCDFKVLRLIRRQFPHYTCAEMFTLSSNTWRQLDWVSYNILQTRMGLFSHGLFCANSFNWIADPVILSFDIHTESFRTMKLPPESYLDSEFFPLMVFKELLSCTSFRWHENCLSIWIMKDYGVAESWMKLYNIPSTTPPRSIFFWMDDQALLLLQNDYKTPVSCNLITFELENVEIYGHTRCSELVVYKETLISIM